MVTASPDPKPRFPFDPDEPLRRAPELTLELRSDGSVHFPDHGYHYGPHALRVLDAFATPRSFREAMAALTPEATGAQDWADLSGTIRGLFSIGILERVDGGAVRPAGAVGFDQPFIVISSGTLELLEPEEQRFVLAQQLGHIMTGRTTYRTIALIVLFFGMSALPLLASIALLPFQLALLEWYRKSELSADRAGMLGTQDPRTSLMTFLKLAGGKSFGDAIDLDAYLVQAEEYEVGGSAWDGVLKALNTALRDTPVADGRERFMSKVSLEVVQLSIECVDPTAACYAAVGRALAADRLLLGQIVPVKGRPQALRVTVTLFDVPGAAPIKTVEREFDGAEAALQGVKGAVDEVVAAATAPAGVR